MKASKDEWLEHLRFTHRLLDRIESLMDENTLLRGERDSAQYRLQTVRTLLTANEGSTQILAIIDGAVA